MKIQNLSIRLPRQTLVTLLGIALALITGSIIALSGSVSATTNQKAPDTKSGNLLIYSDKGLYKKAVIYSPNGELKCAGKKVTADKPLSVGLSKAKDKQGRYLAIKISCEPGTYNVYFLKKGVKLAEAKAGATQRYTAISLPNGYCSFVHKKGVTRNEVLQNNRCVGDDNPDEDKVEKYTPVMTAVTNPGTITQGKKYTMLVELKHPDGSPLSVEECSSSFTTSRPIAGTTLKNNQGEYPIRYNPKTKTCQYKLNVSSSKTKTMTTGIYNLTFKGNVFMNPAQVDYRETVVQGAAAKAASEKKAKKAAGNSATKNAKIVSATLTKTGDRSAEFKLVVSGVDDCNRINLKLDQKIKAKTKEAKKSKNYQTSSMGIVTSKEAGGNCVLTNKVGYDEKLKSSDVSFKASFKVGSKQKSKTTNKIVLGK